MQTWIQTTTLEGNHDYDAWIMEGYTGYDTTSPSAASPPPTRSSASSSRTNDLAAGSGHITGVVVGIKTYTPPKGGAFDFWGGNTGTKVGGPIKRPWLSLSDLEAGDQAVWVGQGNADGTLRHLRRPRRQLHAQLVGRAAGLQPQHDQRHRAQRRDGRVGNLPLNGWWTEFDGYVFNDTNRNGVQGPGRGGVPSFTLTLRTARQLADGPRQNTATTDATATTTSRAATRSGSGP